MTTENSRIHSDDWVDIHGAADILHVSIWTARRLVKDGKLTPSKLGRRHRFDPDELRALLRSERTKKIGAAIAAKRIIDDVVRPRADTLASAERNR